MLAAMSSSETPHDLWLLWARAQPRRSRDDLITCRADIKTLRHMRLPSSSTSPITNASSPDTTDHSSSSSSGDSTSKDYLPYKVGSNEYGQLQQSSATRAVESRMQPSRPNEFVSFWNKQKDRVISQRKRVEVKTLDWNVSELLSGATLDEGPSTLMSHQEASNGVSTAAMVATRNSSQSDDALSHLLGLRLTASVVKEQEEIWNQIKQDPAKDLDAKTIFTSSSPLKSSIGASSTHHGSRKKKKSSRQGIGEFKWNGKRVRIITQGQVQEAWKRGEAIEITCVVCKMRLLTTKDMYQGMVYCPECGAISPSELY